MTIIKQTGENVNVGNTSFQGYINTTYNRLVEVFGNPTRSMPSGDDKVRIEWCIKFSDNTFATIYDWKNYGKTIKWVQENVTEWNIGGNKKIAVQNVHNLLK